MDACTQISAQAISLLRQKKLDDAVKSLNNLLACDKALPADRPVSWDERAELQDLFSTYCSRVRTRSIAQAQSHSFDDRSSCGIAGLASQSSNCVCWCCLPKPLNKTNCRR